MRSRIGHSGSNDHGPRHERTTFGLAGMLCRIEFGMNHSRVFASNLTNPSPTTSVKACSYASISQPRDSAIAALPMTKTPGTGPVCGPVSRYSHNAWPLGCSGDKRMNFSSPYMRTVTRR